MQRKLGYKSSNKMFLYFTVIYIFFQIVLGIVSVFTSDTFYDDKLYLLLLINQYIAILLPVVIFTILGGYSFKNVFRLNPINFKIVLLVIIMSIPAYLSANTLNTIVMYLFQGIIDLPRVPIPVPTDLKELMIQIFVICITPAICEEALHRGIILKGYEEIGTKRAIVFSGIMFGVFHFDILNLAGPVFLGMLIGYYVIRTNSIYAGIIAHFINNLIATILQYVYGKDSIENKSILISSQELIGSIIWGIIAFTILLLLIKLLKKITKDKVNIQVSSNTLKKDITLIITHWPMILVVLVYILTTLLFILSMKK